MREIEFREWDPARQNLTGHGLSYSRRIDTNGETLFMFEPSETKIAWEDGERVQGRRLGDFETSEEPIKGECLVIGNIHESC